MPKVYIPKIKPVRIKTEEIPQHFIDPGSTNSYFPRGVGPRIVYLDERYDYPDDSAVEDRQAERQRQLDMWLQMDADGALEFIDRQEEKNVDPRAIEATRREVYADLGTRSTAEFYERVFSELLGETLKVVAIATAIQSFESYKYHKIGYKPS
jgi:glutathione S-transferase